MNYQLLCVDLDGTLLDERKQLPEENCASIHQAWKAGIEICIASGRGSVSGRTYLEKMGVTGSVVALNGGHVVCHGREIYRAEMTWRVIEPILKLAEEMKLLCYFNTGEKTLTVNEEETSIQKRLKEDFKLSKGYQAETIESLRQKVRSRQESIVKISIREDEPARLEEIREKVTNRVDAKVAKSDVNYLDIFPTGQSKWTGIEKLLDCLKIPAKNCVCFGDNENDREMLEQAGLGIAMGNAEQDLKTKADFVTRNNQECGVAYGIHTWVLGNMRSQRIS